MKLTKKTEYALLVMIELAGSYDTGICVSKNQIANNTDVPRKFLEQILNQLREAKYVLSTRGASGGYVLSRTPSEISLAEIIRLINGALAPVSSVSEYFYDKSPSESNRALTECFQDIRDYTARKLETSTLDQFIED